MGYLRWPRPFQGYFGIRRLGLAMFKPHIKFEMSTITCNEEMKGNAKCKNFRFEPPFGGFRGNVHGLSMARWKARCQLPIQSSIFYLYQAKPIKSNTENNEQTTRLHRQTQAYREKESKANSGHTHTNTKYSIRKSLATQC